MTMLQTRHGEVHGGAARHFSPARLVGRFRAALRLAHRAIITAKTRRAQSELRFYADDGDEQIGPRDPAKYPQRPLILGDKWDF